MLWARHPFFSNLMEGCGIIRYWGFVVGEGHVVERPWTCFSCCVLIRNLFTLIMRLRFSRASVAFGGHASHQQVSVFSSRSFHLLLFLMAPLSIVPPVPKNLSLPCFYPLCCSEDTRRPEGSTLNVLYVNKGGLTPPSAIRHTFSFLSVRPLSSPNGKVIIEDSTSWNENPCVGNSRIITEGRDSFSASLSIKGLFCVLGERWKMGNHYKNKEPG